MLVSRSRAKRRWILALFRLNCLQKKLWLNCTGHRLRRCEWKHFSRKCMGIAGQSGYWSLLRAHGRWRQTFLFENALSHHVHEIEMPIPSHLVAQGPQTCNICRIPCYLRMELVLPGLSLASRQEALDAVVVRLGPGLCTVVQDRATWEGGSPRHVLFVAKSLRPLTALNISRLGRLGDYLAGSIR